MALLSGVIRRSSELGCHARGGSSAQLEPRPQPVRDAPRNFGKFRTGQNACRVRLSMLTAQGLARGVRV